MYSCNQRAAQVQIKPANLSLLVTALTLTVTTAKISGSVL